MNDISDGSDTSSDIAHEKTNNQTVAHNNKDIKETACNDNDLAHHKEMYIWVAKGYSVCERQKEESHTHNNLLLLRFYYCVLNHDVQRLATWYKD